MIRVLIAEDNDTVAGLLTAIIDDAPDMRVIARARDGKEAVEATSRLTPDVVTMDIDMPEFDGVEATRRIMAAHPTPIVIVSGLVAREIDVSMTALSAGAVAVLPKPPSPTESSFDLSRRELQQTLRAMSDVLVVTRRRSKPNMRARRTAASNALLGAVAIAASTGGPPALQTLLSQLPRTFPVPIFVVQHIADGFVRGLVRWLDSCTPLDVLVAEHGEPAIGGRVYVAPDNAHLEVRRRNLVVHREAPVGGFRPSADVLFRSVAEDYGASGLGVILSGMGSDGVHGFRHMVERGAPTLVQSERSCAVFGMPKAAIDEGLVSEVLDIEDMAKRLDTLAQGGGDPDEASTAVAPSKTGGHT